MHLHRRDRRTKSYPLFHCLQYFDTIHEFFLRHRLPLSTKHFKRPITLVKKYDSISSSIRKQYLPVAPSLCFDHQSPIFSSINSPRRVYCRVIDGKSSSLGQPILRWRVIVIGVFFIVITACAMSSAWRRHVCNRTNRAATLEKLGLVQYGLRTKLWVPSQRHIKKTFSMRWLKLWESTSSDDLAVASRAEES